MSEPLISASSVPFTPNHFGAAVAQMSTEALYSVVAITLPPYDPGAPIHMHPSHSEGCYVINGILALTHDTSTITLTSGTAARVPPGIPHTCWNPTAAPTTFLLIYTPGGAVDEHAV